MPNVLAATNPFFDVFKHLLLCVAQLYLNLNQEAFDVLSWLANRIITDSLDLMSDSKYNAAIKYKSFIPIGQKSAVPENYLLQVL